MHQFKRYCKGNINIDDIFKQIKDKRTRPQIKMHNACWAIMNMVPMGMQSLLELGQIGRLAGMRRYIGTKRYMAASDTTYDRVLNLVPTSSMRRAMTRTYQRLQTENLDTIKLESGKELCIAGIDASGFGKHLASVLSIFGKTQITLDVGPYAKKGKELPSSYELINRTTRLLGKGFCGVLIGDGLYRAAKFFRLCKASGFDGLVKTKGDPLRDYKGCLRPI